MSESRAVASERPLVATWATLSAPDGARLSWSRERRAGVRTALYAGSFDPIHLGHVGIIERAAAMYGHVVVAVLANPEKPSGLFLPAQRVQLIHEATMSLSGVSSVHFLGLTVDLARRVGADVLIRAAHKERADEFSMAAMNLRVAGIETMFVPAPPETRTISSSLVRDLAENGQLTAAQQLVPRCVRGALADQVSRVGH